LGWRRASPYVYIPAIPHCFFSPVLLEAHEPLEQRGVKLSLRCAFVLFFFLFFLSLLLAYGMITMMTIREGWRKRERGIVRLYPKCLSLSFPAIIELLDNVRDGKEGGQL